MRSSSAAWLNPIRNPVSDQYAWATCMLSETKKFTIVQMRAVRRRKTGNLLRYEPQTIGMRTIYRARVYGSTQIMTAVVYHGAQSVQWREALCSVPGIRHPNILQLFGVSSSNDGVDALIYHDDFVPVPEVRKKNREIAFASCYSEYSMQNELADARIYWLRATGQLLVPKQYTVWIRRSTGRLCLDVSPALSNFEDGCEIHGKRALSLELEDIHILLGHLPRWESSLLMAQGNLSVGGVLGFTTEKPNEAQPGRVLELACLPGCKTEFYPWDEWPADFNSEVMCNGWTRFDLPGRTLGVHHIESSQITYSPLWIKIRDLFSASPAAMLVKDIEFSLSVWYPEDEYSLDDTFLTNKFPGSLYLFACPLDVRQVGERGVIQIPASNEAFYWSLDPSGVEKLTGGQAEGFNLPSVSFAVRFWGYSWNQTKYDVLQRFYLDKGYNPASIDVAQELDYPLFEVHDQPLVVSSKEHTQAAAERDKELLSTYPTRDEWCLLCEHYKSAIANLNAGQGVDSKKVTGTKWTKFRSSLRRYQPISSQVKLFFAISFAIICVAVFTASLIDETGASIIQRLLG
ncbi:hypothetical protein B0H17DRAFT_1338774 [Mycena rosella]|uniref:Protein kinase domain-containing protein n=1 Tax=Mycena rosella TaxID=1033263 RepID=A0AAD7CHG6_MYCRO|nr:hypothetical protein B0H17DRAFT_1338774 [Mycena rosella]